MSKWIASGGAERHHDCTPSHHGRSNWVEMSAAKPSWTSWLRERFRLIDVFDLGVLFLFAGLSMWVFVLLSSKSTFNHIWTGTDGPFIGDQMQYLGWIEDSAQHLLISNPFISSPSMASFLQPAIAISGGLVRLGLSPSAAYIAWKPIAVVLLFIAVRAYVRHLCTGTAARRVALVIALFYISPLADLGQRFQWFHSLNAIIVEAAGLEMWPGLYLWGYPFTALCVAALVGALLAYERDRASGRLRPWAPLLGLLCAWLQPWQGATLLIVIMTTEAVCLWRQRAMNVRLTIATALATTIPLVYYSILSHTNPTWVLSGKVNLLVYPWLPILLSLAPLALVTILACRYDAPRFNDVAVRVWPVAALTVYCLIALAHVGTFPSHALQGLSVPFAVLLATVGQHIPFRFRSSFQIGVIMIVVVALLVVPSGWREMSSARAIGTPESGAVEPIFITANEQLAFSYLKRDHTPGAVLAPVELGVAVPAETGRRTWVGIYSWTPDYQYRVMAAGNLFAGHLSPTEARHLVENSRTRFLLSDCQHRANLVPVLGRLLRSRQQFGCVTVYLLRSASQR
jgi:hypothetical protein